MSSRRSHLILVVLIFLALIGVVFLAVPSSPAHRSVKQGLDLQGGLEYVLKAQPPKGVKLTAADLDRSVTIMRNRVDKLGVSEPIITKQGSDQISIQLAGVHDVNQAANIIGSTAQLELYDLEPALAAPSTGTSGSGRDAQPLRAALARPRRLPSRAAEPVRALQAGQDPERDEEADDGLRPRGRPGGVAAPRCQRQPRPARQLPRQGAEGLEGAADPERDRAHHLLGEDDHRLPG